jgi:hypothetical protein
LEKKKERDRLFKKYVDDLEKLKSQTKDLSGHTTLENQLTFTEENSSSHVPYDTYKKLQNLTSETIDVSEYREEGVKLIQKMCEPDQRSTPPKLIRSNSYTLDSPSPILLAHLEKEAQKCVEMDDSESRSSSPVTIIDSEVEPHDASHRYRRFGAASHSFDSHQSLTCGAPTVGHSRQTP